MDEEKDLRIIDTTVEEVLHNSMIPYAEYVILDRALPRVEDGLKPVQRRILYSMLELNLKPDKPYRKSARVVGDCLGKYHPHGDSSIYDAMVRLAQDFNTRMPLVDGHGNFGSIDGDNAASMRYTEVKMTPLALELMQDLEKDTVTWALNFDDTLKEPEMLPAKYPNLLVNGASGIAVGLATNIPPHNLEEVIDGIVAQIDKPRITLSEMMSYIKGPDFPTGGMLIVDDGLREAYETGRGKVVMRAKYTIEKDNDKYQMIITEVPYQVNKSKLLAKINQLREEKSGQFANISSITDESDKDGIRAVIRFKNGTNIKKMVAALLSKTQLESNFNFNVVAIANGKPKRMGLLDITSYYIDFQREVLLRRVRYDLKEAKDREHICLGLIIAIENIHKVIDIIKSASNLTEARKDLMANFNLSQKQAQAILDMKLARLAKLEVEKLELEIKELREKIAEYESILASKKKQNNIMKAELLEIKRKYKEPRRSEIISVKAAKTKGLDIKDVNEREEKEGVVLVTEDQSIKLVSLRSYSTSDKSSGANDFTDIPFSVIYNKNIDDVIVFTNKGNAFTFNIELLEEKRWRTKGVSLSSLSDEIDDDEKIVALFNLKDVQSKDIYFYSKQGMVKRSNGSEYNLDKNYYQAVTLKDDTDEILGVELVNEAKTIFIVSKNGMCLNCQIDKIPVQGRIARGVRCIKLDDDDEVVFIGQVDDEGEIIVVTRRGFAKRVIIGLIEPGNRDRKGDKIQSFKFKDDTVCFASAVKMPYDLSVVYQNEDVKVVNSEDINIASRTSIGKVIIKANQKQRVEKIVANNHIVEEFNI